MDERIALAAPTGVAALPNALSSPELGRLCCLFERAFLNCCSEVGRDQAQEELVAWVRRIDGPSDRSFNGMLERVVALEVHLALEVRARAGDALRWDDCGGDWAGAVAGWVQIYRDTPGVICEQLAAGGVERLH